MSLQLNLDSPTKPWCKTVGTRTIEIGNEVIGIFDFLYLIDYVMTNTDLEDNDPRLHFIDYARSLREEEGRNPDKKKLSSNIYPVPDNVLKVDSEGDDPARHGVQES